MESIKPSSLVQLKSGGPIMTVESFGRKLEAGNPITARSIVDETQLNCTWFEDSTLMYGTFDSALLTLVSEPDLTAILSTEAVIEAYTGLNNSLPANEKR